MPRFILRYPVAGTTEVVVDGETEKEAIANYEEGTGYDPGNCLLYTSDAADE